MVVNRDKKIIFIHVPKTAGTTIEWMLDMELSLENFYGIENGKALQHLLARDIKKKIKDYDEYIKFTVVRNPYDRFISEYKWCEMDGHGFIKCESIDEFLSYVEKVVKRNKYDENVYIDHLIPQYEYVYDKKGELLVDYVGKYEELEDVFNYMRKNLKVTKEEIYKLNETKKYKVILNKEQKDRIYNLYKKDFELFNYER